MCALVKLGNYNCKKTVAQFLKVCMSTNCDETDLKKVLSKIIPTTQERVKAFRKEHGKHVVSKVDVNTMFLGLRGVNGLICETSQLDDEQGIRYRGLTIADLKSCLPKACGSAEPLPEGVFWLLCTGEVPTEEQVKFLSNEWAERAALPCHVVALLNSFPKTLHPMAQLSCAVTALNHDSKFLKAYNEQVPKACYWEYAYEDGMDLIAKLPVIAATIYTNTYKEGKGNFAVDCDADWSANFTRMLGFKEPKFTELMRLYLVIHADHESGNVSAHTAHLVGSALADPFLSFAAGLNGLAGPLHGLANQEVLAYMSKVKEALGANPSEEKLTEYVNVGLKSGQVVPGFGHAALRITDPRYTVLKEFAEKNCPNDEGVQLAAKMFKVVPKILQATGKVKNPWPNVDGHSGVVLQHYGMKEMNFYTVLFGVSRAIGVMAQLVWDRALGLPIERPRSLTIDNLKLLIEKQKQKSEKPAPAK